MTSQELGSSFEIITKDFFVWLFEEIEIQINNHWIQKAGYQFGFDVGFEIAILNDEFFKIGVFIECKNYKSTKLDKTKLHDKLIQFDMSAFDKKNAIFIFLSPKVDLENCTQDSNPKLLEDYFNKNKVFKTIILTPNNKIKEIFSLNETIFNKVYKNEIFNKPHTQYKDSILDYFKKLFYSKGEIPNFNETIVKEKYLEIASIPNDKINYINRRLKTNNFSFFNEDKTSLDLLKDNDIILLLGEPGSGKTTELINLCNYFKEKIIDLEITPIFISLSNVKEIKSISDFLPKNWDLNRKIILFLDAFDECEFKNELTVKLNELILSKETFIKIVISCRNYAYNQELESIKPVKFYLNGFLPNESFDFLSKNYKTSTKEYNQIDQNKFKDVLEDPFMINRLGLYYENHNKLANSILDIYNDIIAEKTEDEIEVYQIFALILELTKKTSIQKNELKNLFGIKYKKLIKLEFIQQSFDKENYKFSHKNYQEYFAALAISEMDFDKIIDFIQIQNTSKTHPSLFNTITFLINILDGDKSQELISWLIQNEPELLFKADSNRITEAIKIKLFQQYFNSECIEKKFWIDTNRTFSKKEIADFGNCETNFDYLIKKINDSSNHFRVIISAIELLSFFTIPNNKKEKLKLNFTQLLNDKEINNSIKSNIIKCIHALNLAKEDGKYFDEIFMVFKSETHKELNRALLTLINNDAVDNMFWYLQAEFLRDVKIEKREIEDDVQRGTSWVLNDLILNLKSSDKFIKIIINFFNETVNYYTNGTHIDKIIDKCLVFDEIEDDFIIRFLDCVGFKDEYTYQEKNLFNEFIQKSKPSSQLKAFSHLLNNNVFSEVSYYLSSIANSETILLIIEKYKKGEIENNEHIEYFRNRLSNRNTRRLSEEFSNLMIENGYLFKEECWTDEKFEFEVLKQNYRIQHNFDILFNKEELLKEIKIIFDKNGETIDEKTIQRLDREWYELNGHFNAIIETSLDFLKRLIYDYGKSSFQQIEEILESEYIILKKIKTLIDINKKSSPHFEVSESQKQTITNWSIKTAQVIDFTKIISVHEDGSMSMYEDYYILKLILFFQNEFDFALSQEFLLNTIEFFEVEKSHEINENFEKLIERINDKELVDERIIKNLKDVTLFSFSLSKHVEYALKNNLTAVLPEIKNYFLFKSSGFFVEEKLEKYIKLNNNNTDILKELSTDIKEHKSWIGIGLLMKMEVEKDYCISKAIECLEVENQNNCIYKSEAVSILFQLNERIAVDHYYNLLENDFEISLKNNCYTNYNEIEDYSVLEKLFNQAYNPINSERRIFSISTSFLTTYISNLSKEDESYKKVEIALKKLKTEIGVAKNDSNMFYINLLIDSSNNSYINSKSKALNFNEALKKVEELLV